MLVSDQQFIKIFLDFSRQLSPCQGLAALSLAAWPVLLPGWPAKVHSGQSAWQSFSLVPVAISGMLTYCSNYYQDMKDQ